MHFQIQVGYLGMNKIKTFGAYFDSNSRAKRKAISDLDRSK